MPQGGKGETREGRNLPPPDCHSGRMRGIPWSEHAQQLLRFFYHRDLNRDNLIWGATDRSGNVAAILGSPFGRTGERSEPERVLTGAPALQRQNDSSFQLSTLHFPLYTPHFPPCHSGQREESPTCRTTKRRRFFTSFRMTIDKAAYTTPLGSPFGRAGEQGEPERVLTGAPALQRQNDSSFQLSTLHFPLYTPHFPPCHSGQHEESPTCRASLP